MREILVRNTAERLCGCCGGYHKYYTLFCIPKEFGIDDSFYEDILEIMEIAFAQIMVIPSKFIRTTGTLPNTSESRFSLDNDPFDYPRLNVGSRR